MEKEFESGMFCKVVLTGLFAGIFATLSCLLFDLLFCYFTGYPYAEVINISTIIFAITSAVLVAGLIYYYLIKALRQGSIIFIITFVLLTAFCLWRVSFVESSLIARESVQFRQLLSGILIITGICCFFMIPFLYKNRAFNKYVV
jgi:hypothetical protein